MRIERVDIVGFGCLDRCELDLTSDQTNLILAPNEAGKSTLLAAVEVALYGFPSPRTREGRELRERFEPWSGGPSRVALDLRDECHTYRIEHEILDAAGKTVDQVTVYRDQQDVTDTLKREAESPGDLFFRIGRDDFRRSVLVRQGDLQAVAEDTEQLVQHLESIATSTRAGASATAARDHLDEALEDYRTLAGLEHWAQSYLTGARQWSRVKQRLAQTLADFQGKRRGLIQRREQLAREIEAYECNQETLGSLTKARDCLRILQRAVQRRHLQCELDRDDEFIRRGNELQEELAAFADVESFPANRETELTRLIERESQLRGQLDALAGQQARSEEKVRDCERRKKALESFGTLSEHIDNLRAQLTLFTQALTDQKQRGDQRAQVTRELENDGCPLQRLQEARQCYHTLTEEEREPLRGFELDISSLSRQRSEAEQKVQEAHRELEQINNRRRARRTRGVIFLLGGFAAAVLAWGVLTWGVGLTFGISLLVAGALLLTGGLGGMWLLLGSRHLQAYRCDQLNSEIDDAALARARIDDSERGVREVIDQLARHQNLTPDDLLETVKFYLSHRDKLDEYERIDHRWEEANQDVLAQQRRFSEWLHAVAPVSNRCAGPPFQSVTIEMAESLVGSVVRLNGLVGELTVLRHELDEVAGRQHALSHDTRAVQEALASLLSHAGVGLPLPASRPGAPGLVAPEELVAARREFERLAGRAADRTKRITELESSRTRQLPEQQRAELKDRIARLDAELVHHDPIHNPKSEIRNPQEALTYLVDYREADIVAPQSPTQNPQSVPARRDNPQSDTRPFTDWRLDTLQVEQVTGVTERFDRRIADCRQVFARTWQEARAFLKEYVTQMSQIETELRHVKNELRRACQFADAVEIARETLAKVQSDSYERWSELLSDSLRPLLGEFLPDYRLETISKTLAPTLTHKPTGQILDLTGIRLHLSRGAKDRLFLAMRLALAQVLSADIGVRLPLLLDDPMANWDDDSLIQGMRILGNLGLPHVAPPLVGGAAPGVTPSLEDGVPRADTAGVPLVPTRRDPPVPAPPDRESSIIVFSCQRSRFEWALRALGDSSPGITVRGLQSQH